MALHEVAVVENDTGCVEVCVLTLLIKLFVTESDN